MVLNFQARKLFILQTNMLKKATAALLRLALYVFTVFRASPQGQNYSGAHKFEITDKLRPFSRFHMSAEWPPFSQDESDGFYNGFGLDGLYKALIPNP